MNYKIIGISVAVVIGFSAAAGLYTYQQYTENTKHSIKISTLPEKLDNADLVLPAHKQK